MRYIIILLYLFSITTLFALEPQKDQIGESAGGKPIILYKFGSGKELVIITAGLSGVESGSSEAAYELIAYLSSEDFKLDEKKSVWIIPELNPDGLSTGEMVNANGVALEYNFPAPLWKESYYYISRLYKAGKSPFSEPETAAFKRVIQSIDRKSFSPIVLNFRAAADNILPGDCSQYNSNLHKLAAELSGINDSYMAPHDRRSMTGWLSSSEEIAALDYETEFSKEAGFERTKSFFSRLLESPINKRVYHRSVFSYLINMNQPEEMDNSADRQRILDGLPPEVVININSIEGGEGEFFRLYQTLAGKDELLILVNKANYLDNSYAPTDLFYIKEDFATNKEYGQLRTILKEDLKDMYDEAAKAEANLVIISAYRAYDVQKIVFARWKKVLGEKQAKRVSAAPGSSQHQLGTAIDFNMLDQTFENKDAGKWLLANSYRFGFVLSYPKGMEAVTGYKYEPWHYRYIGREAALLVFKYFDNNLELFLNWYWK